MTTFPRNLKSHIKAILIKRISCGRLREQLFNKPPRIKHLSAINIRTYTMPQCTNRRKFLNILFLTTASPLALTLKSADVESLDSECVREKILTKIIPINDHFVSVNGWVLPTKTLTRGAV